MFESMWPSGLNMGTHTKPSIRRGVRVICPKNWGFGVAKMDLVCVVVFNTNGKNGRKLSATLISISIVKLGKCSITAQGTIIFNGHFTA